MIQYKNHINNNNNNKETRYNTIQQLKQQEGNIITSVGHNFNAGEVVWMQILKTVPHKDENVNSIMQEHQIVVGNYVLQIYPTFKIYGLSNYRTNAQDYFRKPTKTELKQFLDFWRKYRFLGLNKEYHLFSTNIFNTHTTQSYY